MLKAEADEKRFAAQQARLSKQRAELESSVFDATSELEAERGRLARRRVLLKRIQHRLKQDNLLEAVRYATTMRELALKMMSSTCDWLKVSVKRAGVTCIDGTVLAAELRVQPPKHARPIAPGQKQHGTQHGGQRQHASSTSLVDDDVSRPRVSGAEVVLQHGNYRIQLPMGVPRFRGESQLDRHALLQNYAASVAVGPGLSPAHLAWAGLHQLQRRHRHAQTYAWLLHQLSVLLATPSGKGAAPSQLSLRNPLNANRVLAGLLQQLESVTDCTASGSAGDTGTTGTGATGTETKGGRLRPYLTAESTRGRSSISGTGREVEEGTTSEGRIGGPEVSGSVNGGVSFLRVPSFAMSEMSDDLGSDVEVVSVGHSSASSALQLTAHQPQNEASDRPGSSASASAHADFGAELEGDAEPGTTRPSTTGGVRTRGTSSVFADSESGLLPPTSRRHADSLSTTAGILAAPSFQVYGPARDFLPGHAMRVHALPRLAPKLADTDVLISSPKARSPTASAATASTVSSGLEAAPSRPNVPRKDSSRSLTRRRLMSFRKAKQLKHKESMRLGALAEGKQSSTRRDSTASQPTAGGVTPGVSGPAVPLFKVLNVKDTSTVPDNAGLVGSNSETDSDDSTLMDTGDIRWLRSSNVLPSDSWTPHFIFEAPPGLYSSSAASVASTGLQPTPGRGRSNTFDFEDAQSVSSHGTASAQYKRARRSSLTPLIPTALFQPESTRIGRNATGLDARLNRHMYHAEAARELVQACSGDELVLRWLNLAVLQAAPSLYADATGNTMDMSSTQLHSRLLAHFRQSAPLSANTSTGSGSGTTGGGGVLAFLPDLRGILPQINDTSLDLSSGAVLGAVLHALFPDNLGPGTSTWGQGGQYADTNALLPLVRMALAGSGPSFAGTQHVSNALGSNGQLLQLLPALRGALDSCIDTPSRLSPLQHLNWECGSLFSRMVAHVSCGAASGNPAAAAAATALVQGNQKWSNDGLHGVGPTTVLGSQLWDIGPHTLLQPFVAQPSSESAATATKPAVAAAASTKGAGKRASAERSQAMQLLRPLTVGQREALICPPPADEDVSSAGAAHHTRAESGVSTVEAEDASQKPRSMRKRRSTLIKRRRSSRVVSGAMGGVAHGIVGSPMRRQTFTSRRGGRNQHGADSELAGTVHGTPPAHSSMRVKMSKHTSMASGLKSTSPIRTPPTASGAGRGRATSLSRANTFKASPSRPSRKTMSPISGQKSMASPVKKTTPVTVTVDPPATTVGVKLVAFDGIQNNRNPDYRSSGSTADSGMATGTQAGATRRPRASTDSTARASFDLFGSTEESLGLVHEDSGEDTSDDDAASQPKHDPLSGEGLVAVLGQMAPIAPIGFEDSVWHDLSLPRSKRMGGDRFDPLRMMGLTKSGMWAQDMVTLLKQHDAGPTSKGGATATRADRVVQGMWAGDVVQWLLIARQLQGTGLLNQSSPNPAEHSTMTAAQAPGSSSVSAEGLLRALSALVLRRGAAGQAFAPHLRWNASLCTDTALLSVAASGCDLSMPRHLIPLSYPEVGSLATASVAPRGSDSLRLSTTESSVPARRPTSKKLSRRQSSIRRRRSTRSLSPRASVHYRAGSAGSPVGSPLQSVTERVHTPTLASSGRRTSRAGGSLSPPPLIHGRNKSSGGGSGSLEWADSQQDDRSGTPLSAASGRSMQSPGVSSSQPDPDWQSCNLGA